MLNQAFGTKIIQKSLTFQVINYGSVCGCDFWHLFKIGALGTLQCGWNLITCQHEQHLNWYHIFHSRISNVSKCSYNFDILFKKKCYEYYVWITIVLTTVAIVKIQETVEVPNHLSYIKSFYFMNISLFRILASCFSSLMPNTFLLRAISPSSHFL